MDNKEIAASRELMDAVSIMAADGDVKSALAWQSKALSPRENINSIMVRSWMSDKCSFRFKNALKILKQ